MTIETNQLEKQKRNLMKKNQQHFRDTISVPPYI